MQRRALALDAALPYDNSAALVSGAPHAAADREKLAALLDRAALLRSYNEGNTTFALQYRRDEDGQMPFWVSATVRTFKSAANGHIECVVTAFDVTEKILEAQLISRFTMMGYEVVGLLGVPSRKVRYFRLKPMVFESVAAFLYSAVPVRSVFSGSSIMTLPSSMPSCSPASSRESCAAVTASSDMGAIDDVMNLNPWIKLGVQTLAAGVAVAYGVVIHVLTNPAAFTANQVLFMTDAVREYAPDAVIHCGDGSRDTGAIETEFPNIPVYGVTGNCDYDPALPLARTIELDGVRIYIAHGHTLGVRYGNLDRLAYAAQEAGAQIAFYGHTHRAKYDVLGGVAVINPGSAGQGAAPSWGMCFAISVSSAPAAAAAAISAIIFRSALMSSPEWVMAARSTPLCSRQSSSYFSRVIGGLAGVSRGARVSREGPSSTSLTVQRTRYSPLRG